MVINLWWLVLPVVVLALAWLAVRRPGVRARREITAIVALGDRACADIRAAADRAKSEMDRIARDRGRSRGSGAP